MSHTNLDHMSPEELADYHAFVTSTLRDRPSFYREMAHEKYLEAKESLDWWKHQIALYHSTQNLDARWYALTLSQAPFLSAIKSTMARWQRAFATYSSSRQHNENDFQTQIAKAKTVPISTLHAFVKPRNISGRFTALCPFHDERSSSFVVFPSSASRGEEHFHCFGCNAHGDAITFVMKLHQLSFKEAIKHLDSM